MSVIERRGGTDAKGQAPAVTERRDGRRADGPPQQTPPERPPDRADRHRTTADPGKRRRAVLHLGDPQGLRVRRVRLRSVVKIASVFFVLGYGVTLGTLVVLWNVAVDLHFVTDLEELVRSSLGLDEFSVVGRELFDLAVVALGILFALGLVITVLLAVVYNATSVLFGGLAVETAPLRRKRRVYSLRHRGFVDVR